MKWILASSSQGTVLKKIHTKYSHLIYAVCTDRECGARNYVLENSIKHISFEAWNEIPKEIPILLIGFKKILSSQHLDGRKVYNLHPSLLPLYPGWSENVHHAVLQSGQRISGVTLHEVTPDVDQGKILAQFPVPVYENDNVESLKKRCQTVEVFMSIELLNNKQNQPWWDRCVEYLDL